MLKATFLAIIVSSFISSIAIADDTNKGPVYDFDGQQFKLEKFKDHVNSNPDTGIDKADLPYTVDLEKLQSNLLEGAK